MVHSRKLSAKARRAIRERMTPEQKAVEDRCILIIFNDWRKRHGLPTLTAEDWRKRHGLSTPTAEEAGLVPEVA